MEADDVLADDVQIGRPVRLVGRVPPGHAADPVAGESQRGDIVGQRVQPDIHDVGVVARHRHAPIERGPGDRQIPQALADKAHHLVLAGGGHDEIRVFLVKRQQLVGVFRELEEIAGLLHPLHRRARRRQLLARVVGVVRQLALVEISLVPHAVPTGIAVEVNIAGIGQHFPDRLARLDVAGLRGADEIIVGEVQRPRHLPKMGGVLIAKSLGLHPGGDGGFLDLLAVFVSAGQEVHIEPVQALKARHHVGRDRLVGMAQVRQAVHIGNRRGDEIRLFTFLIFLWQRPDSGKIAELRRYP